MIYNRTKTMGTGVFFILAAAGLAFLVPTPSQSTAQDDAKAGETAEVKTKNAAEKPAEKVHTVKAEDFRIETELEGVFEAVQMTPISLRPDVFKTLEVIKAVEHGAQVKQGDQLIELETKDLDDQIAETKLAVELGELSIKSAKEDLKYLEATIPLNLAQAERSHMIAQRELKQYRETDRPLAARSARQSLKNSEGQLENATEELKQLEKMYKADDLTEETEEIILKRARRSVESAELFVELAKVRADRSLKESIPEREIQLTEAAKREDLSLAKLKATLPVERRQAEIALEKLEREQKDLVEKLEKLKKDRELLEVEAPVSGIVYYGSCQKGKWASIETVAKQMEPGKSLTVNQVFMTIVSLKPLQVRMSVDEKDLRHVKNGMKGKAVATAFPDQKLTVTINHVAGIPGATTKFDTTARVAGDDAAAIVPGMTCKVKLVAYEKKDAIAIPEAALFHAEHDETNAWVYVAGEGQKPQKRSVTAGRKHKGKVEITKGLKAGEKILTERPKD